MKKLNFLFASVAIAVTLTSCNLVPWDEIDNLGETPTLINKVPKLYPGGNAECSTINIAGLVQTTSRNNYIPSTDGFENAWPAGLLVKVGDDKSVSFQIDGSINLGDGKCYKVGAVIVKGSDASNVYDYTDKGGVAMDKGLVPPDNSSGDPAGLSNLTFCFVECNQPNLVIAFKSFTTPFSFVTTGAYITSFPFVIGGSYMLYQDGVKTTGNEFGHLTITDNNADGYWEITVDNYLKPGLEFVEPYLYVGTASGFGLDYPSYPYPNPRLNFEPVNTWTFILPFKLP